MQYDVFTLPALAGLGRLRRLSQPRLPPMPFLPFVARPTLKAGYALALGLTLNLTPVQAVDLSTLFKPAELAGFIEVAVGMTPPQVALFIKIPPETVDSSEFLGIERRQLNWRTSAYTYEVHFVMNRVVAKRALSRNAQSGQ